MRIRHLAVLCVFLAGCADALPLAEYATDNAGGRQNEPASYVAYLKAKRFTHGELDHLPTAAILLHGDPEALLPAAGIEPGSWTTIELGTTDPSKLYVVRPPGGVPFMVNRASPGAGGAATQTAELVALGARSVVHIGTCALLGERGDEAHAIVASAAYKDGGAALLSDDADRKVRPDDALSGKLRDRLGGAGVTGTGYTIPIYYFQPEALVRDLLVGETFAEDRPAYMEMEEASVFATARRMGAAAASLTVPSDRYALVYGQVTHTFLDDAKLQKALAAAIRATQAVFSQADPTPGSPVTFWGDRTDQARPAAAR